MSGDNFFSSFLSLSLVVALSLISTKLLFITTPIYADTPFKKISWWICMKVIQQQVVHSCLYLA